jgi:cobalt-zinc-cadmium efflux system protein
MTTHRGHDHARASAGARSSPRLALTLALTVATLVVELVASFWTGSLALLADAAHLLTDAGGLALALFAIWIAHRPPTPAKTYGYYRAEILAALVNAVVLLVIAGGILAEAWQRLRAPAPVLAGPMAVVAALGLAVNLVCAALLHHAAAASLNVRAAYLEVVSDALGSLATLVAAVVVMTTGWTGADPLASVGIALLIVPRTWALLKQAVNVLLEGTPPHLELGEIEAAMCAVPGVRRLHDLHVWTLTSGREAMSAHVVVDDVRESERLLEELHALLHARFGIDHTTMQLESEPPAVLQIKGPHPV